MEILGRDVLRAARPALPRETVSVSELVPGGAVIVQGMSGTDRDAYEATIVKHADGGRGKKSAGPSYMLENLRARLVVRCVVDETGARVWSDDEAVAVGQWPAVVLHRVFEVAKRLSGMSDAEVEELGKLSGVDPSGSLPSESPAK